MPSAHVGLADDHVFGADDPMLALAGMCDGDMGDLVGQRAQASDLSTRR